MLLLLLTLVHLYLSHKDPHHLYFENIQPFLNGVDQDCMKVLSHSYKESTSAINRVKSNFEKIYKKFLQVKERILSIEDREEWRSSLKESVISRLDDKKLGIEPLSFVSVKKSPEKEMMVFEERKSEGENDEPQILDSPFLKEEINPVLKLKKSPLEEPPLFVDTMGMIYKDPETNIFGQETNVVTYLTSFLDWFIEDIQKVDLYCVAIIQELTNGKFGEVIREFTRENEYLIAMSQQNGIYLMPEHIERRLYSWSTIHSNHVISPLFMDMTERMSSRRIADVVNIYFKDFVKSRDEPSITFPFFSNANHMFYNSFLAFAKVKFLRLDGSKHVKTDIFVSMVLSLEKIRYINKVLINDQSGKTTYSSVEHLLNHTYHRHSLTTVENLFAFTGFVTCGDIPNMEWVPYWYMSTFMQLISYGTLDIVDPHTEKNSFLLFRSRLFPKANPPNNEYLASMDTGALWPLSFLGVYIGHRPHGYMQFYEYSKKLFNGELESHEKSSVLQKLFHDFYEMSYMDIGKSSKLFSKLEFEESEFLKELSPVKNRLAIQPGEKNVFHEFEGDAFERADDAFERPDDAFERAYDKFERAEEEILMKEEIPDIPKIEKILPEDFNEKITFARNTLLTWNRKFSRSRMNVYFFNDDIPLDKGMLFGDTLFEPLNEGAHNIVSDDYDVMTDEGEMIENIAIVHWYDLLRLINIARTVVSDSSTDTHLTQLINATDNRRFIPVGSKDQVFLPKKIPKWFNDMVGLMRLKPVMKDLSEKYHERMLKGTNLYEVQVDQEMIEENWPTLKLVTMTTLNSLALSGNYGDQDVLNLWTLLKTEELEKDPKSQNFIKNNKQFRQMDLLYQYITINLRHGSGYSQLKTSFRKLQDIIKKYNSLEWSNEEEQIFYFYIDRFTAAIAQFIYNLESVPELDELFPYFTASHIENDEKRLRTVRKMKIEILEEMKKIFNLVGYFKLGFDSKNLIDGVEEMFKDLYTTAKLGL